MKTIAVAATIQVLEGDRGDYLQALQAHALRCKVTEPGTLEFRILVPKDDLKTVMLYEVYASDEAFQAHLQGASMTQMKRDAQGFKTALTGVVCEPLEI
ncbi:putative quinol monooxygenase [Variovorax arabinosiphilus]|uniref:putative quinol monooxygenase n=1 Tax=Variovorax arabinosiphilus TaxID=3053498 RepID=UPI002576DB36|nr:MULTISPECIES: antibiotic biosynthesis monooxygenase family protein [unclassified Variovorax]MDM0119333.1 antibiotic biosynthesis monooxygenase family protein [Variovorax sp. J2L1-78]MDM0129759.1 antibiotic biosynthesis monooxygenase family protein [Variovorax sp. J2L1-63]MDM0232455.1 antibiotic biosynthesis monooxygenase family protein [Variovorax sp. J2R1-6]